MKPSNLVKSVDVVLKIGGKPIGGQQNAVLTRQAEMIDITNKINGDWAEHLTGVKNWSLTCGGMYIIDAPGLELLENAFLNNQMVEVSFTIGNKVYEGNCLVVDFPLTAIYNTQFKYSIKLLGTGALECS